MEVQKEQMEVQGQFAVFRLLLLALFLYRIRLILLHQINFDMHPHFFLNPKLSLSSFPDFYIQNEKKNFQILASRRHYFAVDCDIWKAHFRFGFYIQNNVICIVDINI